MSARGDTTVLEHYLSPLMAHLAASDVTELVVNRPGEFGVETFSGWRWIEAPWLTHSVLEPLAIAAAAATLQDVSVEAPICSTILPGGERCQIVLPPAAEHISITLRKPSARCFTLDDLNQAGLFEGTRRSNKSVPENEETLTALRDAGDWPAFFANAVKAKKNILISGATGSGKTTFAKTLLRLIPDQERLITIEDTRELEVPHRNVVHLLYAKDGQGAAQVDAKALLESALRMRPDRILLQELRDGTAFYFLRNVNSGHPGSITTLHADSAALAFEQLTLMVKESEGGRDLKRDDIRALLQSLVDIVVQLQRAPAGRFRATEVWYEPALRHNLAV